MKREKGEVGKLDDVVIPLAECVISRVAADSLWDMEDTLFMVAINSGFDGSVRALRECGLWRCHSGSHPVMSVRFTPLGYIRAKSATN